MKAILLPLFAAFLFITGCESTQPTQRNCGKTAVKAKESRPCIEDIYLKPKKVTRRIHIPPPEYQDVYIREESCPPPVRDDCPPGTQPYYVEERRALPSKPRFVEERQAPPTKRFRRQSSDNDWQPAPPHREPEGKCGGEFHTNVKWIKI